MATVSNEEILNALIRISDELRLLSFGGAAASVDDPNTKGIGEALADELHDIVGYGYTISERLSSMDDNLRDLSKTLGRLNRILEIG